MCSSDLGTVAISGQPEDGEGIMTITNEEGETQIGGGGEVPDWVPAHPSTTTSKSLYRATAPKGDAGHAAFSVDAPADEVVAFYKTEMEKMGYTVTVASFSGADGSISVVNGQKDGGNLVASVAEKGAGSEATVQYSSGE